MDTLKNEARIALWKLKINTKLWLCHITRFHRLERRRQIRIVAVIAYIIAMIVVLPSETAQLLKGFGL